MTKSILTVSCVTLLFCFSHFVCSAQISLLTKEDVYKDYRTYTFPGYFEIHYPKEWILAPTESIAFSCRREINQRPVAIATARVIKQISFKEYLKGLLASYSLDQNGSPLQFSTTINGRKTICFNTPVYDETGRRHVIVQYDDNTLIDFTFQYRLGSAERVQSYRMEESISLIGPHVEQTKIIGENRHYTLEPVSKTDSALATGWYFISEEAGLQRSVDRTSLTYFLNPSPIISQSHIKMIRVDINHLGQYGLIMRFDSDGTKVWAEETAKSVGKKFGFIFNDHLLFAPVVNAQITIGVASVDNEFFSKSELEAIRDVIARESEEKQ